MNPIKMKYIKWTLKNGSKKHKSKLMKIINRLNTVAKSFHAIGKIARISQDLLLDENAQLNDVEQKKSETNTEHNKKLIEEKKTNSVTNPVSVTVDVPVADHTTISLVCSSQKIGPLKKLLPQVVEVALYEIGHIENEKMNYYDKNGFVYSKNSSYKCSTYLRCKNFKKYGCNARMTVNENKFENGILTQTHNHEANRVDLDRVKFIKKLEEVCRENPFLKAQDIYDLAKVALIQEINMQHIKQKRKYDSFIHRKQKVDIPLLAKTVEEFEQLINDPKYSPKYLYDNYGKLLYRGVWRGATGSNIVFISDTVLKELRKIANVVMLMDGTFKCLPHHLKFRQLYIISVIIQNRCYPLAYILMEKKDTLSYELIFNNIKAMIPAKVDNCMSDYEAATRKALKKVFPTARISGCYFHYVQAIVKAFKRFGLKKDPKFEIVRQEVSALALLPNEFVLLGFQIASRQLKKSKRWNRFKKYWLKQWATANISVYGLKHRTNNFAESLNKTINLILKSRRPHIWRLIYNLRMVEMNRSDELKSAVLGRMLETRGNTEMQNLNKKIEEATERFKNSENLKAFVRNQKITKDLEQNIKMFLKNVTFNEKLENFFKERIEIDGGADTSNTDDDHDDDDDDDEGYGIEDIDDDDEDYDETIIPNNYAIESNFRQNYPRTAAKRKAKYVETSKKKPKH